MIAEPMQWDVYLGVTSIITAILGLFALYYVCEVWRLTRSRGLAFIGLALLWFVVIRVGNAAHWDWMLRQGRELGWVGYVFYAIGWAWLFYTLRKFYGGGNDK